MFEHWVVVASQDKARDGQRYEEPRRNARPGRPPDLNADGGRPDQPEDHELVAKPSDEKGREEADEYENTERNWNSRPHSVMTLGRGARSSHAGGPSPPATGLQWRGCRGPGRAREVARRPGTRLRRLRGVTETARDLDHNPEHFAVHERKHDAPRGLRGADRI